MLTVLSPWQRVPKSIKNFKEIKFLSLHDKYKVHFLHFSRDIVEELRKKCRDFPWTLELGSSAPGSK